MPTFHLVMVIHAHQPVGNFEAVFEQVYQKSYLPFLDCLARHPAVRLGLHFTAPLFEWFERSHPEYLDRLTGLVERRQVEMLGGGFYEPILVSIPPQDQAEQLHRMQDYLARRFGAQSTGAWLAERVWEPQVPSILASSGVKYTLVDDIHFLSAGFELDHLYGDYVAEDSGHIVRVLPGLQSLRYLFPFRSVEEGIAFLRESAARHPGGMAATGDDCEKFGAWPDTYEHCYAHGWVEHFFAALESSADWLATIPPGEYLAAHDPLGRADLPNASYAEMMEWALPTRARDQFHALRAEFAGRPEVLRFLRGGHWRGFFSKYAESNLLHKKMLHVSGRLHALASRKLVPAKRARLDRARTHLCRAQSNDAYWHGIFGGIYAPHLRTELWQELIRAETLAAEVAPPRRTSQIERLDYDADGAEELHVTSPRMTALLRPADGGTLAALDFRPAGATLINSMQRRAESYHSHLQAASVGANGTVASIHDRARVKESGLERLLRYDRWPRNAFRLLLFSPDKTFEDYQQLCLAEHAALAGGAYAIREAASGRVSLACEAPLTLETNSGAASPELLHCAKTFAFAHEGAGLRIDCDVDLTSAGAHAARVQVGMEIVLNLLAPDAPDRYFETPAGRHPLRWAAAVPVQDSGSVRLRLVDEWRNLAITIEAVGASHSWISPIETVSESEEGFERVYQGSQILVVWPAELAAGAKWSGSVAFRVAPWRTERGERGA